MTFSLGLDIGTSTIIGGYLHDGQLRTHDWDTLGCGVALPAFAQSLPHGLVCGDAARRLWDDGDPLAQYHLFANTVGRGDVVMLTEQQGLLTDLLHAATRNLTAHRPAAFASLDQVVLAVPLYWNAEQRAVVEQAARAGGVPVVGVVSQPVAAAAYTAVVNQFDAPTTCLTCDIGNDTLVMALVDIYPGQHISIRHAHYLNDRGVGNLLYAVIARYIFEQYAQPPLAQQRVEVRKMLIAVEQACLRLNAAAFWYLANEHPLSAIEPEIVEFTDLTGACVSFELGFTQMCELIQHNCDDVTTLVRQFVHDHQDKTIQHVICSGPVAVLLPLQQAIARACDVPVDTLRQSAHQVQSVTAWGAALISAGAVQVASRLPFGIGVVARAYNSEHLQNYRVIESGTSLPTRVTFPGMFQTDQAFQSALELTIAFGDASDPQQCDLHTRQVTLPQPVPEFTPCTMALSVDEQMILTVEVHLDGHPPQYVTLALQEEHHAPSNHR
jgi:molecular chaperone DnaK (HSP70)